VPPRVASSSSTGIRPRAHRLVGVQRAHPEALVNTTSGRRTGSFWADVARRQAEREAEEAAAALAAEEAEAAAALAALRIDDEEEEEESAPRAPVELCEQSMLYILSLVPGHDSRALSRSLKERLDLVRPVLVLGPPALPAEASYRESIGTARAGYGVWIPAHKTISVTTYSRPQTKVARIGSLLPWDTTVSKASVSYASSPVVHAIADSTISCSFWKAAIRQLNDAVDSGKAVPGARPRANGPSAGLAGLRLNLGNEQWHLEEVDESFLKWLQAVENL